MSQWTRTRKLNLDRTKRRNGMLSNRERPLSERNGLFSNRERPLSERNGLLSNRERPLSGRNGMLSNRERPLSARNGLLSNRERPLSGRKVMIVFRPPQHFPLSLFINHVIAETYFLTFEIRNRHSLNRTQEHCRLRQLSYLGL
jgi:hypothetical protein